MRERECVGCVEGRRAGKSGGEKENKSGGKRDVLAGSDGQADMAHAYNHAPGREPFPALGGEGGGNGGHQRQRAAKPPKAIAKHVMPIFFFDFHAINPIIRCNNTDCNGIQVPRERRGVLSLAHAHTCSANVY